VSGSSVVGSGFVGSWRVSPTVENEKITGSVAPLADRETLHKLVADKNASTARRDAFPFKELVFDMVFAFRENGG
jgi:hypothetical protein